MRTTHLKMTRRLALALVAAVALIVTIASMQSASARQGVGAVLGRLMAAGPGQARTSQPDRVPKQVAERGGIKAVSTALSSAVVAGGISFDAPVTIEASPVDATPLWQGREVTYTVTVTNDNNSDDTFGTNRLRVRAAIPANTTYRSGSLTILQQPGGGSSDWTCSYDAGNTRVECLTPEAGDLRPTAVFKLQFKVRVDDGVAYGSVVTSLAEFYNEQQSGPNTVTNTSNTINHPVTAPADLTLSKGSTPVVSAGALPPVALPVVGPNVPAGSVNSGGYIRYDVPFGNGGPANADKTVLTDRVPANTEYLGALVGGSFVSGTTFTITATGSGASVNLPCTVVGTAGSQTIYCRPEPSSPYASGTLPIGYSGTLTYFVKVNESITGGTVVSSPATIAAGLCPNGGSYPPVSCVGTPDSNSANNTSLATQNLIVASSNLSVSKIVQSAVTLSANQPTASGPVGPATPANGSATTNAALVAGTYLTYRITLTNNGPSDAANIRLTELLPSGLENPPNRVLGTRFIAASPVLPSGATFICTPPAGVNTSNNPQANGGVVVCTAPLLAANAPNNTATVDLTVFIDGATRSNLISTSTFDATISNLNRPVSGTATLTTPVTTSSDLVLTKTHTNAAGVVGGTVSAGSSFTYALAVTNNGLSVARGVQLTDTLPTAYQKVTKIEVGRLDGNGVFVTPNARDGNQNPTVVCTQTDVGDWTTGVSCTAAELPSSKQADGTFNPAGNFIVRLTVTQDQRSPQPSPTSYQNCATVTSTSNETTSVNNTNICDTVPVDFSSDVSGVITTSSDTVIAGNQLTYTLTASNAGPTAALNVRLSQALPTGTLFVSAVASAGATLATPTVNTNGTVTATWDGPGGTDSIAGGPADGLTTVGTMRTLTIVVRLCADFQQIRSLTDAQMCTPNMLSSATVSTTTPDPVSANNSFSTTPTVQTRANLQITSSAPTEVGFSTTTTPTFVSYTLNFQNNGPSNSTGTKIVNVLPKGLILNTWNSTVPGTAMALTEAGGVQTMTFTLGVLGPIPGNTFGSGQCTTNFPSSGTITIRAKVEITYPVVGVTDTAVISTTSCLADPDLTNNSTSATTAITVPGLTVAASYPAAAEGGQQQAGSILFYPIYTSDAVTSSREDTKISMTNVSTTENVTVHIFAIDGASCSVLDYFICLTPTQTWTYYASDFDPGNTGYIMAVAVDYATGLPRAYNYLVGDEYVKFTTGQAANLAAYAVQSISPYPAGVDPNPVTIDLKFDNIAYNRLPQTVAVDNLVSTDNRNSTMLILNRIGGDLTASALPIGNISGLLFDDQEIAFSYTRAIATCQLREVFSNSFPRTFTPYSRVVPSGRSGWMKIWTTGAETKAIFGSVINFNPTTAGTTTSFNQGHNLHTLTLTQSPITVRLPLIQPTCN